MTTWSSPGAPPDRWGVGYGKGGGNIRVKNKRRWLGNHIGAVARLGLRQFVACHMGKARAQVPAACPCDKPHRHVTCPCGTAATTSRSRIACGGCIGREPCCAKSFGNQRIPPSGKGECSHKKKHIFKKNLFRTPSPKKTNISKRCNYVHVLDEVAQKT